MITAEDQCIWALGHTCLRAEGQTVSYADMNDQMREAGAFDVHHFNNFQTARAKGLAVYVRQDGTPCDDSTSRYFKLTARGWARFEEIRSTPLEVMLEHTRSATARRC